MSWRILSTSCKRAGINVNELITSTMVYIASITHSQIRTVMMIKSSKFWLMQRNSVASSPLCTQHSFRSSASIMLCCQFSNTFFYSHFTASQMTITWNFHMQLCMSRIVPILYKLGINYHFIFIFQIPLWLWDKSRNLHCYLLRYNGSSIYIGHVIEWFRHNLHHVVLSRNRTIQIT